MWPKRWHGHIKTREDVHDLSDGWPLTLHGVGVPESDYKRTLHLQLA
jgi:hypothetical protein